MVLREELYTGARHRYLKPILKLVTLQSFRRFHGVGGVVLANRFNRGTLLSATPSRNLNHIEGNHLEVSMVVWQLGRGGTECGFVS